MALGGRGRRGRLRAFDFLCSLGGGEILKSGNVKGGVSSLIPGEGVVIAICSRAYRIDILNLQRPYLTPALLCMSLYKPSEVAVRQGDRCSLSTLSVDPLEF